MDEILKIVYYTQKMMRLAIFDKKIAKTKEPV
ncbi:MAG: hypothetical protein K0S01_1084 [Herbinix sp.]|nr:hypothetical protein [Herbinix sp.]